MKPDEKSNGNVRYGGKEEMELDERINGNVRFGEKENNGIG